MTDSGRRPRSLKAAVVAKRNHWKLLKAERRRDITGVKRLALSDLVWRRWVERQINSNPECQRMAQRNIRNCRADELIEQEEDRLMMS
jgi:hypothetical protein